MWVIKYKGKISHWNINFNQLPILSLKSENHQSHITHYCITIIRIDYHHGINKKKNDSTILSVHSKS